MSAHLNRPKMEVDHAVKNSNEDLESEGPDVMQAVQSLLILVAIFEVFPIFKTFGFFFVRILFLVGPAHFPLFCLQVEFHLCF